MKRTFSQTLEALCKTVPEFTKNGSLNTAAIGKATKIHQSTVYRMIYGGSHVPSKDNAKKLCEYFDVSWEQLIGNKPIPALDGGENDRRAKLLEAFEQVADNLPGTDQDTVLAVVESLLHRHKKQK